MLDKLNDEHDIVLKKVENSTSPKQKKSRNYITVKPQYDNFKSSYTFLKAPLEN
jgi:hypothetical protein